MKLSLPWHRIQPGEGIFVPGLDVEAVARAGMLDAIRNRVKADATPGIRNGLLGVLFTLRLGRSSGIAARSRSRKPSAPAAAPSSPDPTFDWTL
jgi:hypothetical protein